MLSAQLLFVSPENSGRGFVTGAQTAAGYIQSIEETMNGEVIRMRGGLEDESRR